MDAGPPPAGAGPLEGRRFGPYEIVGLLGHGGMAVVYRARQPALNREVALKVLPPYFAREPGFLERFEREARTAARLSHPNILPVYDYGQEGNLPYFVMPLVAGGTLADWLEAAPPIERGVLILSRLLGALGYAHEQGVVHRDVKPANVLMGGEDWPLLTDFGIARLVEQSRQATRSATMIGTPGYMAPEQSEGRATDHRADLYAVGVILYQMLTGRLPFGDRTLLNIAFGRAAGDVPPPSSLQPGLSPAWDEVLARAVARDADARYPSARALDEAIQAALATANAADRPQPRSLGAPPGDSPPAEAPTVITAQSAAAPRSAAPAGEATPAPPTVMFEPPERPPAARESDASPLPAASGRLDAPPPAAPALSSAPPPATPTLTQEALPVAPAPSGSVLPTAPSLDRPSAPRSATAAPAAPAAQPGAASAATPTLPGQRGSGRWLLLGGLAGLALAAVLVVWRLGGQAEQGARQPAAAPAAPAALPTGTATAADLFSACQGAVAAGRWADAATACERVRDRDPALPGLSAALATTYTGLGKDVLARGGPLAEALTYFDEARRLAPGDAEAREQSERASAYKEGGDALAAEQWPLAAERFAAVYAAAPDYLDAAGEGGVKHQLYTAELSWGQALLRDGRLAEALPHCERALELVPDSAEASACQAAARARPVGPPRAPAAAPPPPAAPAAPGRPPAAAPPAPAPAPAPPGAAAPPAQPPAVPARPQPAAKPQGTPILPRPPPPLGPPRQP